MKFASFTYKLFFVSLLDNGGYQTISITPNHVEIINICKEISKKKSTSLFQHRNNEEAIQQAENQLINNFSELLSKASISIEKRYWFGDKIEKCKNDAIEYIDNNLSNGIDYVIKNNIFPSLNVFLILNF